GRPWKSGPAAANTTPSVRSKPAAGAGATKRSPLIMHRASSAPFVVGGFMSRFLLAAGIFALVPSFAAAQLDPELNKPYHLRVVLRMAENRMFTPLFKDRVRRGLQDGLQAALGNLGQVEVVTRSALVKQLKTEEAPLAPELRQSLERTLRLLEEVDGKGLQQALDEWKEVSQTKTHFVLLNVVDGQYEIQARQFDGLSGL